MKNPMEILELKNTVGKKTQWIDSTSDAGDRIIDQ